jgi:hypothetical protein
MKDNVFAVFGCLFMIVILIAIAFLGEFIFRIIETVGLFLAGPAAPYLMKAFWTIFLVEFFVILPISFIPKCKKYCSVMILYASYFYGILTWIWGFVAAYFIWGKAGIIIGLFLFGVGVVPVGFLAALLNGQWIGLAFIIFGIVLTYGTRAISIKMAEDEF